MAAKSLGKALKMPPIKGKRSWFILPIFLASFLSCGSVFLLPQPVRASRIAHLLEGTPTVEPTDPATPLSDEIETPEPVEGEVVEPTGSFVENDTQDLPTPEVAEGETLDSAATLVGENNQDLATPEPTEETVATDISVDPTLETLSSMVTLESSPIAQGEDQSQSVTDEPGADEEIQVPEEMVPVHTLIQVDPTYSIDEIKSLLQSYGTIIESDLEKIGVVNLITSEQEDAETFMPLTEIPGILSVSEDFYLELVSTVPNDPLWSEQYGLINIHAPEGWQYAKGNGTVTIAILDTGVDLSHPDLASQIVSGIDFVNLDVDPQDDNGHGTSVAGIAAAITNNNVGVAGTGWNVNIMPVKVLDAAGGGSYSTVASGIIWATDNGADVINLSLGGALPPPNSALQDAINYAYNQGVVIVAASGNTASSVLYPARLANVIAVAATDNNDLRAAFSNFGPEVDVSAPGVMIFSTDLGGGYIYSSGTSMSAPFVSGLAAILSQFSNDPGEIWSILTSTAKDLGVSGYDEFTGFGLIQMDDAIVVLVPPKPKTQPSKNDQVDEEAGQDEEEPSNESEVELIQVVLDEPNPSIKQTIPPENAFFREPHDDTFGNEPADNNDVQAKSPTSLPVTSSVSVNPPATIPLWGEIVVGLVLLALAVTIWFGAHKTF